MEDSVGGGMADAVHDAATRVAGGVQSAVVGARQAATQTNDAAAELRRMIHAQPITMTFLALSLGYVLGRLASGRMP